MCSAFKTACLYRIYSSYRKPKKGIEYLMDTGVLDEYDAEGVCKFLKEEPGVNKQKIGEFLGNLRNPLSMAVLQ